MTRAAVADDMESGGERNGRRARFTEDWCCCACAGLFLGPNPMMARYLYALIFLVTNLLAWTLRDYGNSALAELQRAYPPVVLHARARTRASLTRIACHRQAVYSGRRLDRSDHVVCEFVRAQGSRSARARATAWARRACCGSASAASSSSSSCSCPP